jgi:hypothetical protein
VTAVTEVGEIKRSRIRSPADLGASAGRTIVGATAPADHSTAVLGGEGLPG